MHPSLTHACADSGARSSCIWICHVCVRVQVANHLGVLTLKPKPQTVNPVRAGSEPKWRGGAADDAFNAFNARQRWANRVKCGQDCRTRSFAPAAPAVGRAVVPC